jgi:hypothetical protein
MKPMSPAAGPAIMGLNPAIIADPGITAAAGLSLLALASAKQVSFCYSGISYKYSLKKHD